MGPLFNISSTDVVDDHLKQGFVEDGEEILQLFTLKVGIFFPYLQLYYLLLGLWLLLFFGSSTEEHSTEESWILPTACSIVVERDGAELLVLISVLSHLENLSPVPAGYRTMTCSKKLFLQCGDLGDMLNCGWGIKQPQVTPCSPVS